MSRRLESPRRTWPCPGLARDQQKGFASSCQPSWEPKLGVLRLLPLGMRCWRAAGVAQGRRAGHGEDVTVARGHNAPPHSPAPCRWLCGGSWDAREGQQRNPREILQIDFFFYLFFLQDFARLVKKPGKIEVYASITCRQREILCKCFKPTLKVLS